MKVIVFILSILVSLSVNAQRVGDVGKKKINIIDKIVHLNDNQRSRLMNSYEQMLFKQDSVVNTIDNDDIEKSFNLLYNSSLKFEYMATQP